MMKRYAILRRLAPALLASAFVLPVLAAESEVVRLSEPVEVTDEWPIDAYYKYDDELG